MKNKWVSFVISIVLTLSVIFSFTVGVYAQSISVDSDRAILSSHVLDVIHLIYDEQLSKNDQIVIGNEIQEYFIIDGCLQESELDAYPIIINDQIIGIIKVSRDSNNTISQVSIGKEYACELQTALTNKSDLPFVVLHTDDGVYIKFSSCEEFEQIRAFSGASQKKVALRSAEFEYTKLTQKHTVAYEEQLVTATANTYKQLSVTRVANASPSCCSGGICWAACMAMMSNYYRNTSYSAMNVHDYVGCVPSGTNYHVTHREYIRQLGMTVIGTYDGSSSKAFSFDSVCYWIDRNNLMHVDLQGGIAHNVLCHGYYSSAQGATYCYLMDPNYGSVLCSVPETASGAISIALRNTTYSVHCYIAVSG